MARFGVFICVAAVAGAGLLAACGDSDSGSITKAEFVEQANAICKKAETKKTEDTNAALQSAAAEGNGPPNVQAQARIVTDVALPPVRQMTEELAALEAPSGEERAVEEMVASFEKEVQAVESEAKKVAEGDAGFFEEANEMATELGLNECAEI